MFIENVVVNDAIATQLERARLSTPLFATHHTKKQEIIINDK
jgi:hypothetical protein